jgi:hypothetical protein
VNSELNQMAVSPLRFPGQPQRQPGSTQARSSDEVCAIVRDKPNPCLAGQSPRISGGLYEYISHVKSK